MGWLSLSDQMHYFLVLIIHSQFLFSMSISQSSSDAPQCHPDESIALLQLRSSFSIATSGCGYELDGIYPYLPTKYWNKSRDCCTWNGITCDEDTGHVIGLDLQCSKLRGTISPNSSLFLLHHLQRLDLSLNDFRGSPVLKEFSQFENLTHLYLIGSNFRGQVPFEISNLSKLVSFQISANTGEKLSVGAATFKALSHNLTELRELQLIGIDMSSVPPAYLLNLSSSLRTLHLLDCKLRGKLPENVFQFPKLQELRFAENEAVYGSFPTSNWSIQVRTLEFGNNGFSINLPRLLKGARSLTDLTLYACNFVGSFPALLGNFKQLVSLDLSSNSFRGHIPWSSFNFKRLRSLDLSYNNFIGQLPEVYNNSTHNFFANDSSKYLLGSIPSRLSNLKLAYNLLNGTIPSWIYALPYLEGLDLRMNQFTGEIYEFYSSSLYYLYLSNNKFIGNVNLENLSKSIELSRLDLSSNNLSLSFNNSINYTFDNLWDLGLSSCNLNQFPQFLRSSKFVVSLDLSCNHLQGSVPKWLWEVGKDYLSSLNLSFNNLTYIEPLPWRDLVMLDLRSNMFSGPLQILAPFLQFFSASKNQFTGELPISICNMIGLEVLDISFNRLNGSIPQCMGNFSGRLSVLDLRRNKLQGPIPATFAKRNRLRNLNLNGNQLEGSLPRSLEHCRKLEVLDLGNNQFKDLFPDWLQSLPRLRVLVLRYNMFYGVVGNPKTISPFRELRIMDLSSNEFSGFLPKKYFENFKGMMNDEKVELEYMGEEFYQDSVVVTMKGLDMELVKIQTIFTTIDFSRNNFIGEIPKIIGNLKSLKGLNFSHNMLRGTTPLTLGNLTNLEWLDLSSNELFGEIPAQLADLTMLSSLNVSHNQLVGPIPSGNQFGTFGSGSFVGNLGLCGFQVSKTCNKNDNDQPSSPIFKAEDDDINMFNWKIIMMGYGSGLVIGISLGYILLSTDGELSWFCERIVEEQWHARIKRRKKRKQRSLPAWRQEMT